MDPVGVHSSTNPLSELLHRQSAEWTIAKDHFSSFQPHPSSGKSEKVPFATKPVKFDRLTGALDLEQQKFLVGSNSGTRKIEPPKAARIELPAKTSSMKTFQKIKAPEAQKMSPPVTYTKDLKSDAAPEDLSTSTGNQVDVVA